MHIVGNLGLYEYPDIGIEETIKIIQEIRREFEDTSDEIDPDRLAQLIGHNSSSSGTFRGKITALRRYGLLEERDYKLTDLAETIIKPSDEDDFQLALVEARDNVELFFKLVEVGIDPAKEEAESTIREVCQVSKNNEKKVKMVLTMMQEFANRIGKKNWLGRFVDDSKLEKNIKRLLNPKLVKAASGAIWSQFKDKPAAASQILKVFDAFKKAKDDQIRLNLLRAIRDGMGRLALKKADMNEICDCLVDIIIASHSTDTGKVLYTANILDAATEALASLRTERHYDKLLRCLFDYCKNNRIFDEYDRVKDDKEDDFEEEEGERGGRPEQLLYYLEYVNKDRLVEAIWEEMEKENDESKRRQLEELLERIEEVKISE